MLVPRRCILKIVRASTQKPCMKLLVIKVEDHTFPLDDRCCAFGTDGCRHDGYSFCLTNGPPVAIMRRGEARVDFTGQFSFCWPLIMQRANTALYLSPKYKQHLPTPLGICLSLFCFVDITIQIIANGCTLAVWLTLRSKRVYTATGSSNDI